MQIIYSERKKESIPQRILSALPYKMCDELRHFEGQAIEEIRLRRGRNASLTVGGKNIMLNSALSSEEMEEVLTGLCTGSLYAFSDTMNKGYISLPDGIRVGVCGRAAASGEQVIGVFEVSSMVIRIPHRTKAVGEPICRLLKSFERKQGVLIYSPPGVGKTTLLRGIALNLASGDRPLRTVVIDTRGELSFSLDRRDLCLDILTGYPRRIGIEIATRCLSAEVIICDEIGDYSEAMELVASHNCGVPLVASAHAGSVPELLRRTGLRLLHEADIFGAYVGIERREYMDFNYDIQLKSEIGDIPI